MSSPKPPRPAKGETGKATSPVEPPAQPAIGDQMQTAILSPRASGPAPAPDDTSEFDAWLRGHLGRLYASVLTEPVPERFLRILEGQPG
jgi:Anti-sigma factor NepR